MKKLLLATLVTLLAACSGEGSSVRNALGVNRSAPDEFKVVSRPPLSVPPEFRLLPPAPGEKARGLPSSQDQAESLVRTGEYAPSNISLSLDDYTPQADTSVVPVLSGELESVADASFLSKAGADGLDASIRQKLRTDSTEEAADPEEPQYGVSYWFGAPSSQEVVDAKAESERIRENIDAGKPVNEGEVQTIIDEPSALDLLF